MLSCLVKCLYANNIFHLKFYNNLNVEFCTFDNNNVTCYKHSCNESLVTAI